LADSSTPSNVVSVPDLNSNTNGERNVKQSMSLEEARELAEFTGRIVSDLNAINADGNDLEEKLRQTGYIADNLKVINSDNNPDLEVMLEQTGNIVNNLSTINEDENDIDSLLEKTNSIASNLQIINESEV